MRPPCLCSSPSANRVGRIDQPRLASGLRIGASSSSRSGAGVRRRTAIRASAAKTTALAATAARRLRIPLVICQPLLPVTLSRKGGTDLGERVLDRVHGLTPQNPRQELLQRLPAQPSPRDKVRNLLVNEMRDYCI